MDGEMEAIIGKAADIQEFKEIINVEIMFPSRNPGLQPDPVGCMQARCLVWSIVPDWLARMRAWQW